MLCIQSTLVDDMALILGMQDKAINKDVTNGRDFPQDVENYLRDVYMYVRENLYYIETLIHQFAICGGISEGVYECDTKELIWTKL